ncbi:MAG: hypothetical protein OXG72_21010, partial [Acidobacteria bacterium]|nr:hypothetical protein [Acidobacteriota bacterium]
MAAYLYDTDPSGSRNVYPNAMLSSGAAALLADYRGPSATELPERSPLTSVAGGGLSSTHSAPSSS